MQLLITLMEGKEKPVPEVVILYGPPDSGKSRYAYDNHPLKSIWSLPAGRDIWYDGYYGQPVALIDEFAGKASRIALAQLLRILDRYPIRVPFKGGFIPFIPKKIYITSNVHPSQWYDYTSREYHFAALCRRVTMVVWIKRVGVVPTLIRRVEQSAEFTRFMTGPPTFRVLDAPLLGVGATLPDMFDF